MITIGPIGILVLLPILGLEAVTIVHHHPDDEYVLDHEVPRKDALAEAKKMEIHPGSTPGCKPCIDSEMTYCEDGGVIEDHCCCEENADEVFPFVEHTCRVGPEACKVRAGNCAEYTRLRECCCHTYLASQWKKLANGAGSSVSANLTKFLSILTVLVSHLLLA